MSAPSIGALPISWGFRGAGSPICDALRSLETCRLTWKRFRSMWLPRSAARTRSGCGGRHATGSPSLDLTVDPSRGSGMKRGSAAYYSTSCCTHSRVDRSHLERNRGRPPSAVRPAMIILGINAYQGDASACLVVDGSLVAAAEEERFLRVKHWAGLPLESIRFCLGAADIPLARGGAIAVNRDPRAHFASKLCFALPNRPSLSTITDRVRNAFKVRDLRSALGARVSIGTGSLRAKVHRVEHHRAHLASSFLVSPFETAAVASIDGFGDFASTTNAQGRGDRLTTFDRVTFPHSLGLFYLAGTQYLGFQDYGDEYKVMGL